MTDQQSKWMAWYMKGRHNMHNAGLVMCVESCGPLTHSFYGPSKGCACLLQHPKAEPVQAILAGLELFTRLA